MTHHPADPRARRLSPRLSPTVLLVDDEAAVRRVLARQLLAGGYRVIPAASGREALAILTEQAATIQLLLTDVMMPGLIGPQLVAIVQLQWPGPRPLSSAGGGDDWAMKLMHDSHSHWVQKPFTSAQLREALELALPAVDAPTA